LGEFSGRKILREIAYRHLVGKDNGQKSQEGSLVSNGSKRRYEIRDLREDWEDHRSSSHFSFAPPFEFRYHTKI